MHIRIEFGGEVRLVDVDNFKRFHIEVANANMSDDAIAQALTGLARKDGGGYWFDVNKLVAVSGRTEDIAWQASLRSMLEAVRKFGWISLDGQRVKAHVQR